MRTFGGSFERSRDEENACGDPLPRREVLLGLSASRLRAREEVDLRELGLRLAVAGEVLREPVRPELEPFGKRPGARLEPIGDRDGEGLGFLAVRRARGLCGEGSRFRVAEAAASAETHHQNARSRELAERGDRERLVALSGELLLLDERRDAAAERRVERLERLGERGLPLLLLRVLLVRFLRFLPGRCPDAEHEYVGDGLERLGGTNREREHWESLGSPPGGCGKFPAARLCQTARAVYNACPEIRTLLSRPAAAWAPCGATWRRSRRSRSAWGSRRPRAPSCTGHPGTPM